MALTKSQMGNRVYLQTALENLRKQQDDALRANETTFRQNQRLLGQYNAMNGIRSSGMDESAYVRLLQGRNAGQTSINSQYAPQMAELQGYLDILNARRSSGGRRRSQQTDTDITPLTRLPATTYKIPSIGVGKMATGGVSSIPITYRQRYTR